MEAKEGVSCIDETTDGESVRSQSGAERKSPALQLSEVEEILEHSDIVPAIRQESPALFESSEASERDVNDSLEASSATATEEEEDSSDTMTESQEDTLSVAVSVRGERRRSSIMSGLWACLGPVTSFWKGRKKCENGEGCAFEIAFADIKELEFLGSGAQGAVFSGEYRGEKVAVKKVKDKSYCNEICQLRKLSHRNIVQFKYVHILVIVTCKSVGKEFLNGRWECSVSDDAFIWMGFGDLMMK